MYTIFPTFKLHCISCCKSLSKSNHGRMIQEPIQQTLKDEWPHVEKLQILMNSSMDFTDKKKNYQKNRHHNKLFVYIPD